MTQAISDSSLEPFIDPSQNVDSNQLPDDLKALSEKHYNDCNVRSYFVKIALAQEQFRDGKLNNKSHELQQERDKLKTINTFLEKVSTDLSSSNEVILSGHYDLTTKLFEIFPDARFQKDKLTRKDAEMLSHALTRRSDQEITPNIQEITTDMTHIIEDLDKILPILKELLKAYDDLINRINNKPNNGFRRN